jgi:hypothetical protein
MSTTVTTYKDPENYKELIEGLSDIKSIKEVIEYIDRIFPSWIITFLDGYSPAYPSLTKTWNELCKNIGVKPTAIMIVDHIEFTTECSLIQTFGELFTNAGFAVRNKYQLVPCVKCGKAYPTEELHELLRNKGVQTPEVRGCC